jgi:2-polyprenyl-3-methyl-5-hydroxy-6-metoxy-1,4-benzoquinol methylase
MQGGNTYNKYETRNAIERALCQNFIGTIQGLVNKTGARTLHEVGCGEGYLLEQLAAPGRAILGSDLCEQTIFEATNRLVGGTSRISLEVADILALTPEKHAADVIVCCEVLEHLEDPERAVQILAQLAKPYLVVSVPREPLWRVLNMCRLSYVSELGNTPGHLNHWSRGAFVRLLERHVRVLEVRTPLPWVCALCSVKE